MTSKQAFAVLMILLPVALLWGAIGEALLP